MMPRLLFQQLILTVEVGDDVRQILIAKCLMIITRHQRREGFHKVLMREDDALYRVALEGVVGKARFEAVLLVPTGPCACGGRCDLAYFMASGTACITATRGAFLSVIE